MVNSQDTTVQRTLTSAVLEKNPLIHMHTHMYMYSHMHHRGAHTCTQTTYSTALPGFSPILGQEEPPVEEAPVPGQPNPSVRQHGHAAILQAGGWQEGWQGRVRCGPSLGEAGTHGRAGAWWVLTLLGASGCSRVTQQRR